MRRNRRNEIILFCIVALVCAAVIVICIAVSAGKYSSESSSPSTVEQTEETVNDTTPGTTSGSEPEGSEPEPVATVPAEPEESTGEEIIAPAAESVISLANSLIGTDFVDGGESPAYGFDNSGFIYYVLRENGYITCPRGVSKQAEMGTAIEYGELRKGDLVFFSESGTAAEFGGIYIGGGKMIACLMPGTKVKEVDITTGYYTKHFYRGVAIS